MRSVASGISSELVRSGSLPGFLLEITLANGSVLRVNTTDVDFDFGGNTYASADVSLNGVSFDGTVSAGASIEWGDMTIAVWVGNLYRSFDEAIVRAWMFYVGAPGVAESIGKFRVGKITRKVDMRTGASCSMSLDADATALYAPRRRIQDVVDQKYLVKAGTLYTVNDQPWRIERPSTTNM